MPTVNVMVRSLGMQARQRLSSSTIRLALGALGFIVVVAVFVALPSRFWPFVVDGITDGAIYSLAALGLVLTYKTSGIFNFAVGAQAAASAYIFYTLRMTAHWPWPIAALCSLVLVGLIGSLVLERMAFWLTDAPPIMKVVASIGLLVLIQSTLTGAYGEATLSLPAFLPTRSIHLGSVAISVSQIIVTLLAVLATVGLYVFFKRHRIGVAMQAVVDDPNLLALDAISPVRIRRYAWAIGSCFVSVSGMLLAPLLGVDVNEMLLLYIAAFGAAAVGYFTSLPITFVAAMAIGIVMNLMSYGFAGQSNVVLSELYIQVPFITLVLALLLIPKGRLLSRANRGTRRLPPIRPVPVRLAGAGIVAAIALALAFPALVGQVYLNQYTTGLGFAIVLGSLGLLIWTSGQISLCQMAFAAVGATTFAHAEQAGIPWLAALLLAGVVAVPIGALAALPSFRLSGVYLAVATFGLGLLLQNLVYTSYLMFGSADFLNVARPSIPGLHLSTDEGYFYVSLLIAALCGGVIVLVRRSRLGRLLRALSDSPVALDAHAVNTRLIRLYVFGIAAFLAGIGGAVIAGVTRNASGQATGAFGYFNSIVLVAVLAFCWRRPLLSPLLAAFVFEVLKVYPPFNDSVVVNYEGVVLGLLALGVAVLPGVRVRNNRSARTAERFVDSPVRARLDSNGTVLASAQLTSHGTSRTAERMADSRRGEHRRSAPAESVYS